MTLSMVELRDKPSLGHDSDSNVLTMAVELRVRPPAFPHSSRTPFYIEVSGCLLLVDKLFRLDCQVHEEKGVQLGTSMFPCKDIEFFWPHPERVSLLGIDQHQLSNALLPWAVPLLAWTHEYASLLRGNDRLDVVRKHLGHRFIDIRTGALDNPILPHSERKKHISQLNLLDRAMTAQESRSLTTLQTIIDLSLNTSVIVFAASNPVYPLAWVQSMRSDGNLWAKLALAVRPDCPTDQLEELVYLPGTTHAHQLIRNQARNNLMSKQAQQASYERLFL